MVACGTVAKANSEIVHNAEHRRMFGSVRYIIISNFAKSINNILVLDRSEFRQLPKAGDDSYSASRVRSQNFFRWGYSSLRESIGLSDACGHLWRHIRWNRERPLALRCTLFFDHGVIRDRVGSFDAFKRPMNDHIYCRTLAGVNEHRGKVTDYKAPVAFKSAVITLQQLQPYPRSPVLLRRFDIGVHGLAGNIGLPFSFNSQAISSIGLSESAISNIFSPVSLIFSLNSQFVSISTAALNFFERSCGGFGSTIGGLRSLSVGAVHLDCVSGVNRQQYHTSDFNKWLELVPPILLCLASNFAMCLGWWKAPYARIF